MRELPFPIITLPELGELAPAELLVLTVNNRLARTLTSELAAQLNDGAVELLRIEPWTAWLTSQVIERLYDAGADGFAQVLDSQTARIMWADAIASCETERSLIDTDQVAAIAADADALILNWHIAVPAGLSTPDYRRFLQWRQAYQLRLQQLQAVDVPRLSQPVAQWIAQGHLSPPPHVVLLGFTEVSAAMRQVLDALSAVGVQISQLVLPDAGVMPALSCVAAQTPHHEWAMAIAWANEQLSTHPDARFAIVVPNLQNQASEARRLLQRDLQDQPYNVAVAPPLSHWPLGRAMLDWLRVMMELAERGEVDPALAGRALLSGGCAGSQCEAGARALLDARWRHRQWLVVTLAAWQQDLQRIPRLSQAWDAAWLAWHDGDSSSNKLSWFDWANRFRRVLAALGFPGDGTQSSVQYQATAALDQTISTLAALDDCLPAPKAQGAWQMLSRLANQTLFQPQRDRSARLDVLGLLEAEGGRWDGVWVMGVTDDVLPAVVNPNPLIPVQALAGAGAPRSTAARELAWALQLMQALCRCGPQVVFSWAQRDGERPNRMSPLLRDLPLDSPPAPVDLIQMFDPVTLVTWQDQATLPIDAAQTMGGGVAVLQTQAANPLWALFQYRLGAQGLPAHAQWPAAFDRGNLLHGVMQTLWERWGDQTRMLAQITSPEWPQMLRTLVQTKAVHILAQWPAALRELEQSRAFDVISRWLVFESERAPFKVIARESEHTFVVGDLALKLAIDRIDELASGQRVVFDYKSGTSLPKPEKDWQTRALRHPQLLVYASVLSAEGRAPDALAWVHLHASEVGVQGLAGEEVNLPGVTVWSDLKWAQQDWPAQLEQWDRRICELARQFAQGLSENRFWHKDDLKHCHIKPLLRLHAQADDE
jgi:probable DNA repair protein